MPSERVCPKADINYKHAYDTIVFEAYLQEMEKHRKRKK